MLCGTVGKRILGLAARRPLLGDAKRWIGTTTPTFRISERSKIQFKLPGRTTGVLSSGVVPYPNDPMIPQGKYFKPTGLDKYKDFYRIFTQRVKVFKVHTAGFMLLASPWDVNEHPRDHNGLRIRDYRVAATASKKKFDKKAYPRWQAMRTLRLAAALVLPDKGLKRCDYVFIALGSMRNMDRDEVYALVERALVEATHKILTDRNRNGRVDRGLKKKKKPRKKAEVDFDLDIDRDEKILNVTLGSDEHGPPIRFMSDIIKDMSSG